MTLRLTIENMDRLPDGGPLRVEVKARGLDIGRDSHLDWTLPDSSRYISSKHCEVRYRDNEYWLYDVSTNGTFVNGAQFRLDAPYRLRNGDRLSIGPYIVAVAVEGGRAEPAEAAGVLSAAAPPAADVWGGVGEVAPPEGREAYRVRKGPATPGDFLDFATDAGVTPGASVWSAPDAPAPSAVWAPPARSAPPSEDEAWLTATPAPTPEPARPDPRALPLVERPRPTRPAEAAAAPPPAPEPAAAFEPAAPRELEPAPAAHLARSAPPEPADAWLIERIAAAAGIPRAALDGRDPAEVADEIGAVLRLTAESLIQMAASRRQVKSAIRSAQHTMYKPTQNNPLKFAADLEHAMATMFGPPSRIHQRACAAVGEVFDEAKAHNVLTYGAMQSALDALFAELAPDRIEASLEPERGIGAMMASRKARLWDVYAERWRTLTKRADGRLNDAFMVLFSEAYDRLTGHGG